MDQIEYQLLARIAAGDGHLHAGGHEDRYLLARLLQLRARGLVSFVSMEDEQAIRECRLTPDGMALLDGHRRVGGTREIRAAGLAQDPSSSG